MEVSCKSCPARFAVPDDKVRGRKVKITCKRCGAPIIIDATGGRASVPSVQAPPGSVTTIAPPKTASAPPAVAKPAPPAPAPASGRDWAALESSPGTAGAWREPAAAEPSGPRTAPIPHTTPLAAPRPAGGPISAPKHTMLGGHERPAPGAAPAPPPAPPPAAPAQPQAQAQASAFSPKRTMLGIGMPAILAEQAPPPQTQPLPQPVEPSSGLREVAAPPPARGIDRGAAESDSAASEPEWTVALSDEHHEEMHTNEVVELYVQGGIDQETFIWADGMEDWKRPWEIPLIAAGLAARGLAPPSPDDPSAPEWQPDHLADAGEDDQTIVASVRFGVPSSSKRAPPSSGRWREPGLADRKPAVGFDDVTVSLDGRKAQELLRAVTDQDDASDFENSEDAPTRIHQSAPDLLDGLDEPTLAGSQFSAEGERLSSRPPVRIAVNATGEDDATEQYEPEKLTGARNEDSVLFSLDKLSESARAPITQQQEPSLLDDLAETRQVQPPSEVLARLREAVDPRAQTLAIGAGAGHFDDLAATRQLSSGEALLGPKSGPPHQAARLAPPPGFSGTLPLTPAPVLPDPTLPSMGSRSPAQAGGYPSGQSGGYPPAQGGGFPQAQSGGYPPAQSGGYPLPNAGYPGAAAAPQAPIKKSGLLIWLLILIFFLMIACTLAASYLLKIPANLYGPNGQPKLPF